MNEKIRLPKEICTYLDEYLKDYPAYEEQFPFVTISVLSEKRSEPSTNELQNAFAAYVNLKKENQWKIIEAIQRGYESAQLYYVPMPVISNEKYLNQDRSDGRTYFSDRLDTAATKTKFAMSEIISIDPRFKHFAIPVEEVDK